MFYQLTGKKDSLLFMNQNGRFVYYRNKDVQLLELPYAGEKVSMVLLLPASKNGIASLEKKFSYDWYMQLSAEAKRENGQCVFTTVHHNGFFRHEGCVIRNGYAGGFQPNG